MCADMKRVCSKFREIDVDIWIFLLEQHLSLSLTFSSALSGVRTRSILDLLSIERETMRSCNASRCAEGSNIKLHINMAHVLLLDNKHCSEIARRRRRRDKM